MRMKNPMSSGQRVGYLVLIVLVAILAATSSFFYREYTALAKNAPKQQESVTKLLQEVGRLIILPDNESPTVATVSDLSKLKNQVFFEHAKVGDKVLIYTNAKKAILYSPSEHKIVEVAPLNIGAPTATSTR